MIRAAKFLGVAPWDLLEAPSFWLDAALEAESAQNAAEAKRMKDAQRKAKRGSR